MKTPWKPSTAFVTSTMDFSYLSVHTLPMMGATFTEDLGDGSNRDDDAASAWTGDSTTTTTTPPPSWCELDTDLHAAGGGVGREGRGVRRRLLE
ncbi:uncharacterized protein C14orf132 homolog isoform X2 [Lethenteron reissneri]|uniref:uncharacterized protein C14orf132 homolog isoform X2 n=1 Tax=Lethenteron reissneri TaxID=7753 RepID=UPI002AB6E4F9|nr:uncharacterized protein C14orf132 homolog isoform X2 [Lethenteron reissneri]